MALATAAAKSDLKDLFQDMIDNPGKTPTEYADEMMDILETWVVSASIDQLTLVATDSLAGSVTMVSGTSELS